jgi:hypothetical protein
VRTGTGETPGGEVAIDGAGLVADGPVDGEVLDA